MNNVVARLVARVAAQYGRLPEVEAVLLDAASTPGAEVVERVDRLVDGLEALLREEKLL